MFAAPTASPLRTPDASLAAARKVMRGPASISVIGDSTGNDENEWVQMWAADLGSSHQVTLRRWLDDRYSPDPTSFGSAGDKVTIWNASQPGASVHWATEHIDVVEAHKPDLVLVSFGHNNSESNVGPQLEDLRQRLNEGVPVVLILQNPGRGAHEDSQAATLRSAQGWAASRHIPTIDVTTGFSDPDDQMRDDIHPNEAGSRVWADVVGKALGG